MLMMNALVHDWSVGEARAPERVLIAMNGSKEMNKYAVEWTLSNVVRPGDEIVLLPILGGSVSGKKLWGVPLLVGDCGRGEVVNTTQMGKERLNATASRMIRRFCKLCHAKQVNVEVRVVAEGANGATAAVEAAKLGATWVVLDRQLKKEGKCCMDLLCCSVVLVDRSNAKVLRLNLNKVAAASSCADNGSPRTPCKPSLLKKKVMTTESSSSPELGGGGGASSSVTEQGGPGAGGGRITPSTTSSSEPGMSPMLVSSEYQRDNNNNNNNNNNNSNSKHSGLRPAPDSGSDPDSGAAEAISEYESSSDASNPISESPELSPLQPKQQQHHPDSIHSRQSDMILSTFMKQSLSPAARKQNYLRELSEISPVSSLRQERVSNPISSPNANMSSGRLSISSWKEQSGKFSGYTVASSRSPRVVSSSSAKKPTNNNANNNNNNNNNTDRGRGRGGDRYSRRALSAKDLLEKFDRWDEEDTTEREERGGDSGGRIEQTSNVRRAMALNRKLPLGPPPLCSICQHKVPVFGKPPRRFSFAELEVATCGFSRGNFLAEGGFGSVHRGVLQDRQAVAVKQHKLASSQGDVEFCAEVEVLSCAQHRNVVMLIGYCVEENRRLLVYEFICNGSLDSHLYGKNKPPLEWSARQKVALGAARGLRYLHEECRVGCIVHRDMRPNNILLTHDFEPMVGDFGLARWQPDGDFGEQTRVIGTFGYLAPEYIQSGEITEKADVYSFGVVLLELVTGRKAIDINRPKGQQCLTEWARPLLVDFAIQELVDPALEGWYSDYEVYCMLHAASLCISKDPHSRPRMSQVLRILEGDIVLDATGSSKPSFGGKAFNDPAFSSRQSVAHAPVDCSRLLSPSFTSYKGSIAKEASELERLSILGPSYPKWHSNLQ